MADVEEVVCSVLKREIKVGKIPIYHVSKALTEAEIRYQKMEKTALSVVVESRKLKRYFLAHSIMIQMDLTLRKMLYQPGLAERLMKWTIELSEFEISLEVRKTLKTQIFTDFLNKMSVVPSTSDHTWVVFTDGSSNSPISRAWVILENKFRLVVEVSLRFKFLGTNNQVEYEELVVGISLIEEVG